MDDLNKIFVRLKDILETVDVNKTTFRELRAQLELEFGIDLKNQSEILQQKIIEFLENKQITTDKFIETQTNAEQKKDPSLSSLDGEGKGLKRKREESDAHSEGFGLTNESDVDLEEPQKKKAKEEVTTKKTKKTKSKETSQKNDDSDTHEKPKKKKSSSWSKPKLLSPALAHFLREQFQITANSLPRSEVVRKLHEYIKAKNLQDPKDRRRIIFDEALQNVFKTPRTTYFKINSLLTKHLADPRDIL